jgi:aldose 1-epimerase
VRPTDIHTQFDAWMPRDVDGFPMQATATGMPSMTATLDDCFLSDNGHLELSVANQPLSLQSNCSHWVVYNGAKHGVCVEPQSGAPGEVHREPFILEAGETLTRWFEISWPVVV